MTCLTERLLIVIVACCIGSFCTVAASQEVGRAEADNAPTLAAEEEIVVRGRLTDAALRKQIEQAQEAFYGRFNEINSNDGFDIHCRQEVELGSRIPRRICRPNFWREAQATAGTETVRMLQGSYAAPAEMYMGGARHQAGLLDEELRRLAGEDPQLRRTLIEMTNLEMALEAPTRRTLSTTVTSTQEITGSEASLPYGATRMTEVRFGREPLNHALEQRTFTIAHLFGEISAVSVACDERSGRLDWELGVEWTLPADWGACTLIVEAPPSTAFSLYEFK
jgi:hypothetical protein